MDLKKIDLSHLNGNIFHEIGKEWMLITAKKKDGTFNTMTASWGQMGVLWNKNIATCYVRPQRHTFSFIEEADTYTLTFFPEGYKEALLLLGTKSGRDGDKIKEAGLTPVFLDEGVTFAEGKLVFLCKKLYTSTLKEEDFLDKNVVEKNYPQRDFHHVYIGEILETMHA